MKTNNILLVTLGVIGLILVVLLVEKDEENEKLRRVVKKQSDQINSLRSEIAKIISSTDSLPDDIQVKLNQLSEEMVEFDEKVSKELLKVTRLIEIGQKSKAIFSLSKIIETLLRAKLKVKQSFQKMIQLALESNLLTEEEYHFTNGLRTMRNKEAHELDVVFEEHINGPSLVIAFGIIAKLSKN